MNSLNCRSSAGTLRIIGIRATSAWKVSTHRPRKAAWTFRSRTGAWSARLRHHQPPSRKLPSMPIPRRWQFESWQKALKDKGWADTYLAGPAFKEQLAKDVASDWKPSSRKSVSSNDRSGQHEERRLERAAPDLAALVIASFSQLSPSPLLGRQPMATM